MTRPNRDMLVVNEWQGSQPLMRPLADGSEDLVDNLQTALRTESGLEVQGFEAEGEFWIPFTDEKLHCADAMPPHQTSPNPLRERSLVILDESMLASLSRRSYDSRICGHYRL